MITKEDFEFIVRFDGAADPKTREAIVKEAPAQMAKTFLNLMNGISSLQTLQYLLTLVDDTLQEDKGRADVFKVSIHVGNVFLVALFKIIPCRNLNSLLFLFCTGICRDSPRDSLGTLL